MKSFRDARSRNRETSISGPVAAGISILSFMIYLRHGDLLLYGDAVAHISTSPGAFSIPRLPACFNWERYGSSAALVDGSFPGFENLVADGHRRIDSFDGRLRARCRRHFSLGSGYVEFSILDFRTPVVSIC